jgi:hypothetical protein
MQFAHGEFLSRLTFLLLHVTHVRGLRASSPGGAEGGLFFSAEFSGAVSANMAHAAGLKKSRVVRAGTNNSHRALSAE